MIIGTLKCQMLSHGLGPSRSEENRRAVTAQKATLAGRWYGDLSECQIGLFCGSPEIFFPNNSPPPSKAEFLNLLKPKKEASFPEK